MTKTRGFLFTAGIALALAFTFSCGLTGELESAKGGGNASLDGTWQRGILSLEINGTVAIFKSAKAPRKGNVSINDSIFSFVITHVLQDEQWLGGGQAPPLICNYVLNGNVITFSDCSSEFDDLHDVFNGVWTRDNSSTVVSSSSINVGTSSSSSVNGGGKGNDISNYRTVRIDEQVWMAENLDYAVKGSKCYDNLELNCNTYGRLYDWATAMNIDADYGSDVKHRGICPSGWHIPSNDDWDKLFKYVDEQNGGEGDGTPYNSYTAGKYLKATSGWNSNGNGTDKYDFSALPGGSGLSGGTFITAGDNGYWWSSSEYISYIAYYRYMGYSSEYAFWGDYDKSYLFSVRCLQD